MSVAVALLSDELGLLNETDVFDVERPSLAREGGVGGLLRKKAAVHTKSPHAKKARIRK